MSTQQKHFRGLPLIIKLDESQSTSSSIPGKVQVLRTGKFTHPEYGDFEITPEILLSMKKNFEAKARGVDLAIDFGHQSDKEAAAWIKNLELSDDGQELWLSVEWTPKGQMSLSHKEYRYLSADFTFNYTNNETNKSCGPTLFGAGLTNRPVIKDMEPIVQLQESIAIEPKTKTEKPVPKPEGDKMDPKDQKIQELEKMVQELKAKLEGQDVMMGDMNKKLEEYKAADAKAQEAKIYAEKKTKFDLMLSEGKVVEAQREAFMKDDFAKFTELAQPIKLAEAGHSGDAGVKKTTEEKAAEVQIIELAEEKMKANARLERGEAIRQVLAEKPELKKAYNEKK